MCIDRNPLQAGRLRKAILLASAFALLACSASSASTPPQPQLSQNEWVLLNSGEPVLRDEVYTDPNGNSVGNGYALIKVNAPPKKVWDQILDYDSYAEFFPNVDESKLYLRQGNLYFVRFTLSVVALVKVTYHCKHIYHPEDSWLEWRLDESKPNDFKATEGRWNVWPIDNGSSLVSYTVFVDSGRDVPQFIEELASKWGLKQVVLSIKKRVESGGTYTR